MRWRLRQDRRTATANFVAATLAERGQRHLKRMAGVSERGVDHIGTMDGPEILNSVDQIEKLDKVARRTFRLDDNPLPAGFTLNVLNINSLEDRLEQPGNALGSRQITP